MTDELTVRIGIGDWEAEYLEEEPKIDGQEALIELRRRHAIGKTARMVAAARARAEAPADIIKPDKLLYQSGIEADIATQIANRKVRTRLENGKEIDVREFVGTPPGEAEAETDPDAEGFDSEVLGGTGDDYTGLIVDMMSQDAHDRALRYLTRNVPGYVRGRLEIIAANRGDVRTAAQELVGAIWQMVEALE